MFPPIPVERRTREEFEELVARVNAAQFQNYSSFDGEGRSPISGEEFRALSRAEIQRFVDNKFPREFDTLEELEAYVGGKVLLNKLGLLIKPRAAAGRSFG